MEHENISEIREEIERQMANLKEPLFVSEASSSERHVIACLHLAPDEWDTYAEGYRKAGDAMVEYIIDNDMDQDLLVYPIAFLYRQYLELRIKELWRVSSKVLGRKATAFRGHDLMMLWSRVRPNVEQAWPESKIISDLEAIEEKLGELCAVDRFSESFRYPEDRRGAPSLARMRYINLAQLQKVIQAISNVLDGISFVMGNYRR
ncbi:MAG: hypothetical protein ACYDHZ_09285 [Dehalococcoidia bacterium]